MRFLATLTLLLFAALLQAAPDHAGTEQVTVRLIAERDAVRPGGEVLIGLEQRIIPGWHTYWQNPGDSGMATSIAWRLPDGASAGPLLWPPPGRHRQGDLTNYGYVDKVVLLTAIRVPESAKPESDFPVAAKVNWLVCNEEVCVPQDAELGLTLRIAANDSAQAATANPEIQAAKAMLPQPAPWPASVTYTQDGVKLRVVSPELSAGQNGTGAQRERAEVWFYPFQWGVIAHGAPQIVGRDDDNGGALTLDMRAGEAPAHAALDGLLVVTEKTGGGLVTHGFVVHAEPAAPAAVAQHDGEHVGLPAALLLALLGGLILNLMPCVFPVLSIKALALVKHGGRADRATRLSGWAYTAGVVMSFLLLAGLLLLLRAGGAQIGWGFQFQSPGFVLAIAWLMFAIGLSLSGVFTLGNSVAGLGGSLGTGFADKPGHAGSFFTGVLATIVATPCTAPYMGAAIAYALAQSAPQVIAVFAALGLGLALPYLLLSHWPLLQKLLPKPGVWMEKLKHLFALPMYATALWLLWVLAQQARSLLPVAIGGLALIAAAAWLFGRTRHSPRRRAATLSSAALVAAACAGGVVLFMRHAAPPAAQEKTQSAAESYSEAKLQALRDQGQPVFLNFTAAWCITCLVNERVALSQDSVQAAFKADGIRYLKGDWTNQDAAIARKLAEFGRDGVPLYVFYPAGKNAQALVLPQILTPDIVLDHIRPQP
ncbi:MAG: thioredoxin family protein [Zoogloeaceae bacterium]|nr:thioredoxin family protein [Zoogloeaceae bacterium]